MGILTPVTLERYCDWIREQVLKADQEIMPTAWLTSFDFFKAFRDSPICLCMAASIATTSFLMRKLTKAELEIFSARFRTGNEVIADVDEARLINEGLEQLNDKLREFSENPYLLPENGLLRFR